MQLNHAMCQMHNENIKLRRGDFNKINSLSPQGVDSYNLGFINRAQGNKCNEAPPIQNRVPQPHAPNVVVVNEPIEELIHVEEILEE